MNEIKMRGYVLLSAVEYLRKTGGESSAKQILDGISSGTRQAIASATEANWCSSTHIAELYRGIASLSKGDDMAAQRSLIECGKYTARAASNTFLRLLMKMLTPALFAKKLPDIWARDCTGGKIEVEVQSDRIRNRLLEIAGFDHVAPVAAGYVTFALEAMGKSVTKTEIHGWSLAAPGAPDCWFEVFWKV